MTAEQLRAELIRVSNMLNASVPHGPADPDDSCPEDCRRCALEKRFSRAGTLPPEFEFTSEELKLLRESNFKGPDAASERKARALTVPCTFCGGDARSGSGAVESEPGRFRHYSAIQCAEVLKAKHSEGLQQHHSLCCKIEQLSKDVRDLCGALILRRAMEPRHSDPDHTCQECELIADIVHRETYGQKSSEKKA